MHETGELVQVIGPFIDKLSLVFNCDESECQGQAYYIDSLVGKRDWLQLLPWNFRGPAYAHNWYITLNDLTAAKCLLQASPARGQFRIEFNPNRAGPTGMVALRRRVAETLTNYASLLFSEGGLTRLDIAVDVSPVELNYLKTFAKGLALSSSKYGSGGRHLETIYLGSERSKLQLEVAPFL